MSARGRLMLAVAALGLAACAGPDPRRPDVIADTAVGPDRPPQPTAKPGGAIKLGKPYRIAGIWYYPEDNQDYDETGYASWYGPKFHGRPTANGERFDMNQLSAAHRTLPLPSLVLVTNLENGRSIKVRINDRGPFVEDRIIDLSRRAAQFLGFEKQGIARVRVQRIRGDGSLADASARPVRAVKVRAAAAEGPYYVQLVSLTNYARANAIRRDARQFGRVELQRAEVAGRRVFRVRIGPFDDRGRAEAMLDRVWQQGFHEARVFTEKVS